MSSKLTMATRASRIRIRSTKSTPFRHLSSSRLSDNPIYAPHSPSPSPSSSSSSSSSNPLNFNFPPPPPQDFPPISERLKPLLPFFLYWTVLTSLAFHLLRVRTEREEHDSKTSAQISVLEGLIKSLREAQSHGEGEDGESGPSLETIERQLEMVGLRERNLTMGEDEDGNGYGTGSRHIGWKEVIFGRKRKEGEDVSGIEDTETGKTGLGSITGMSLDELNDTNTSDRFKSTLQDELPYQSAQYPSTEDIPGCMKLFDEFLSCYALVPQLRSIYRYNHLSDCSKKLEDFKYCMSTKSMEADEKQQAWIRRRAGWWAGRRVEGSSEDVWERRREPLENFPPVWPEADGQGAIPENTTT